MRIDKIKNGYTLSTSVLETEFFESREKLVEGINKVLDKIEKEEKDDAEEGEDIEKKLELSDYTELVDTDKSKYEV